MKESIQNALPIVAAAYGEKFGIRILFEGKQAKTDGNTIVLPAVEITSTDDKTVMWGYLAHEAAHIRYTNFNVVSKINQPIKHALLNIVEDIRIELCLAKTYPGTLNTINAVITHLVNHKEIRYPKQDTPLNLLQMMCLFTLRLKYLKQMALVDVQRQVTEAMQLAFPLDFNNFLAKHFDEVPYLTSTQDALDWVNILLLNIVNLPDLATDTPFGQSKSIQSSEEDHPSKSNQEDIQKNNTNQDNEKSQNPNSNYDNKTFDLDKNKHSNQLENSHERDSVNQDGLGNPSTKIQRGDHKHQEQDNSAIPTRFDTNALEKISASILNAHQDDIAEDLFAKAARKINKMAKGTHKSNIIDIGQVDVAKAHKGASVLAGIKEAIKESSLLRIRLRNWLVTLQQTKPAPKQKGQRLISKRLALSQSGESRLFEQYINKTAPNADIHLLVDRSSSMNRTTTNNQTVKSYSDIANQAALSLALALEGIVGITLAVTYFGKSGNLPALTSVLRPNERVTPNASKFHQQPNGNTPMAEALWFAVHDMLKLKNKRKIIIVITDGKPSGTDQTMEIIQKCVENNFELVGIGIKEDYVKTLFNHSIVINDLFTLKDELFKVLKHSLV